ncbi:hypothetical protein ACLOJK_009203 [Asimina triloba]
MEARSYADTTNGDSDNPPREEKGKNLPRSARAAKERVKVVVSKRAIYLDPEDREPIKEIPPKEEGLKEPLVAPESCGETSSTISNLPPLIPEKIIPPVYVESSSPTIPRAPLAESTFMKVLPQWYSLEKPPRCRKCKLHTGKCALQPNTCFRCTQPGHQAKDYLCYEVAIKV